MKIFMIGGTGLLGSEAAKLLIQRGHQVVSLALPPVPKGANIPKEMELSLGNYLEMSDRELKQSMSGCEGFVFAAGVDERVEGPAPIYDMFYKYNIAPVKRLLALAKESGIKHAVILGSYFAYFNRVRPELQLTKYHPYIRSRIDQENAALDFAGSDFDVSVLELPYIFGTQPGRKPVWVFLVQQIMEMKGATLYPKGGTAMVTVRQVGQCIAGALERGRGGNLYPVGYFNLTWVEMLKIFHKHMGVPDKKIVTIPTCLYRFGMRKLVNEQKQKNIQGGLQMVEFTKLMTSNLFIDRKIIVEQLGVSNDDLDAAIGDSVQLCMDVINRKKQVIDMKGE